MKKLSYLIVFVLLSVVTNGQSNFGIKLAGGVSAFVRSFGDFERPPHQDLISPSAQLGFFYLKQFTARSGAGAELLVNQVNGHDRMQDDLVDAYGNDLGHLKNDEYHHNTYISLPVYYSFSIKKLALNAGFQVSYILKSNSRIKIESVVEGVEYNSDDEVEWSHGKFDFGPRVGVTFSLNDQISLEGCYYHGIKNLLAENRLGFGSEIRQVMVGVRYTL